MRWRSMFLFVLVLGACRDEPTVAPAPPPPTRGRRPIMAPRHVATPASFDLVSTSRGPVLVWGLPATEGGSIRAVRLTPTGDAAAPSRHVAAHDAPEGVLCDAMELDAAAGGGRLGVAWIWRSPVERRAAATYGDDGLEAFAPPRDLGPVTSTGRVRGRGLIAMAAAPSGAVAALHRGADGPCEDGDATPCATVTALRLVPDPGPDARVPLALPAPCERPVVGYAFAAGTWYYGLCDESEGLATVVFALQFDPRYARAERVLPGCRPRGMTAFTDGAFVLGECPTGLRGVGLSEAGRARRETEGAPTVRCEQGRPVLEGMGSPLPLEAPRDGLAVLLPERVAAEGDRAVWTGSALLVAGIAERELTLRRWECVEGALRRTDKE